MALVLDGTHGLKEPSLGYLFGPPQGRLTLTSATPVLTSNVTAGTTIYYTPYVGDLCPIYNGTAFVPTLFTEVSQALSDATKSPAAAAVSSNYDMFAWDDSDTIRCTRGPAWTDGTTRSAGTALVRVNGILLNSVAITNGPGASRGTYVGTIRTDASGNCVFNVGAAGTAASIFLWNMYNRDRWSAFTGETTNSWLYETTTIRAFNGNSGLLIDYVTGLNEGTVDAVYNCRGVTTSNPGRVAIGYDSVTVFSGCPGIFSGSALQNAVATFKSRPGLGRHQLFPLERGATGTTFYGDNGDATIDQGGLFANGEF